MVQRINPDDIERIKNNPEEYLYIRPPTEEDYKIYAHRGMWLVCGQDIPINWHGYAHLSTAGYYFYKSKCVYWDKKQYKESRAGIRVKQLEWVNNESADRLQVTWGFTIA